MTKVIAMLVALALFGAVPAVAAAQTPPGEGDTVSSGNDQDADIEQDAQGGGDGDGNGDHGNGHGGNGNAGNQAAICQQNAGGDAICDINQSQRFGGDVVVRRRGHGHGQGGHGGAVHGVGGGGVTSVALARTGFDAWLLALLGGVAVAGGVGLLAVQRRGRLHG